MKKTWKKLLAVGCALSMVMTAPGMSVLAEELQEEEIVVTDVEEVVAAEIPDDELTDSGEVAEDVSVAYVLEEVDELTDDVEMVGSIKYTVGDGVTATFDEETGAVEFNSDGGTLWNDWREQSGLDSEEIKP